MEKITNVSMALTPMEKKQLQKLAKEQNTTVSRLLYSLVKKNGLI